MALRDITRSLRKRQTESEAIFWGEVRNRKLGFKFVRQYAINFVYQGRPRFFIADFYCAEKKLVVEIDGEIHEHQKDYDELRTQIINELGICVIRFKNEELDHIDEVRIKLQNYLLSHPSLR